MNETRIPIQRVDGYGNVTGRGTARQRGVTIDDYRTTSGAELKPRPGESIVVTVVVREEGQR